jgi:GNAT superfamily N-acetyltransferase
MKLYVQTYADHPELPNHVWPAVKQRVWPEFMFHDPVAGRLWHRLERDFAAFQFALRDSAAGDRIAAVGHTLPFCWEGDLPDGGWDEIFEKCVADLEMGATPNQITAIEASIAPEYQGQGVSRVVVDTMREIARTRGFTSLVAPVRPTWKPRYPLTPIERYVTWTHDASGAPFDPWLRTHWRMGARIEKTAPRSMVIPGSVAMWEKWTGLRFPDSGDYIVPGALTPLRVDVAQDSAVYVEPNVWMRHTL